MMTMTPAQIDRAVGALLGTAAGDALGAPYEFGPPRGPELEVVMGGGGVWEPGEWTDDASMASAIDASQVPEQTCATKTHLTP
ncbi:ADP-ribosylglycohydrolase family protein [Mycobacterium simiae]|uniref:ADP-ribosylglycohydrolase family protein n=1 Tax=Mycobacterium simiae TaxID=1784 RepID=UPI0034A02EC2